MFKREILVIGSDIVKEAAINADFSIVELEAFRKKANKAIVAAIIEVTAREVETVKLIIRELKNLVPEFSGQFLAFCTGEFDKLSHESILSIGFDGILVQDTPQDYIKSRLQSIARIQNMFQEATLRFHSLKAFGGANSIPDFSNKRPRKVLIYSEPCPEALICNAILENIEVGSISAPSSFLAFDYLHSAAFDAVIIIAKENEKSAFSFTNTLRKNSRLFHLPCLILTGPDFHIAPYDAKHGATDVAHYTDDLNFAIGRLLLEIDEKRRREALSLAFAAAKTPIAIDVATGLYSQDFFKHHLLALCDDAILADNEMKSKPISVGIISIALADTISSSLSDTEIKKIRAQIGGMISRLVRVEDTACALAGFRYAVVFAYSDKRATEIALERIIAVLASSAFDFDDKSRNIAIDLEGKAVQLGQELSPEELCAELLL